MLHVALDVHLRLLPVRGCGQGHNPKNARADALGDGADGAALARAVAALKHDDDPQAFIFDPFLELTQLRLQPDQFLLVFFAFQFGIAVVVLLLVPFVVFSFRTIIRINFSKCYASSWFRDRGERFRLWFGKLNRVLLASNQGFR